MKAYRVAIRQNDFQAEVFFVQTMREVCEILTGCPLDFSAVPVQDMSDAILINIVHVDPKILEKFPFKGWNTQTVKKDGAE